MVHRAAATPRVRLPTDCYALMSKHVVESEGFVLHRRDYGESSKILHLFTLERGRVDALCKGCRGGGKSAKTARKTIEPFRKYTLAWSGRSELKTLRRCDEIHACDLSRDAERLYCGLYLNELLHAAVRANESEPVLFRLYERSLAALGDCRREDIAPLLRRFELGLIQLLGYGVALDLERDGQTPIDANKTYAFEPGHGFCDAVTGDADRRVVVRGDTLRALAGAPFHERRQLKEAKRLTRCLLAYYLPHCAIQSRKLFA